jgi:hypothetical protein
MWQIRDNPKIYYLDVPSNVGWLMFNAVHKLNQF